jgi:hypothetical protein
VAADTSAAADPAPVARPDSVAGTLAIEGMPEPATFRLYRAPPGFPLGFSTYLPADLAAVPAPSGDGEAVRFEARFGGSPNPEIYLEVVALPEGTSTAEATERARRAAEERGEAEEMPEPRYPWASAGFTYRGAEGTIGAVSLGRHAGRHYYVVTHLPAEAADGFGPRAAKVLEEWRWSDTGAPLGGG